MKRWRSHHALSPAPVLMFFAVMDSRIVFVFGLDRFFSV